MKLIFGLSRSVLKRSFSVTQHHRNLRDESFQLSVSLSPLANRILLDINARARIKYDHSDNRDVESGRRKIAVEMLASRLPWTSSYQALAAERRGNFCSPVLIRSNISYGETVTNVRLL